MKKIAVAILIIPESTASVAYGLYDLFCSAERDWSQFVLGRPQPSPFEVSLVARYPGPQRIGNGVSVSTTGDLSAVYDIVCVPEVAVTPDANIVGKYTEELAWLRRNRHSGAVLATACTGALLLAEAGLLDGHETTTHWLYCDRLRSYSNVTVHEKRSLVVSDAGHLVAAGGGAAYTDLALYLIARHAGVDAAMKTARISLIQWHDAGQQPFSALAAGCQNEDAIISECQIWVAQHYEESNPVAAMLSLSGLKERSFHRRFKQATGMTPMEYVHTVRMEEGKQILETTSDPVERIAVQVGYEDPSFFSRLFRRKVGLTPTQYRRRFGGLRKALRDAIAQAG